MPYEFHWQDSEQSIIRVDITAPVSWEEFHALTNRVVDELENTTHRIDLIYNDKVGMPKGNPTPHLKANMVRMNAQPNLGFIITVTTRGLSTFTKLIVDATKRGYDLDNTHNGGFVATLDEALHIIAESRKQANTPTG